MDSVVYTTTDLLSPLCPDSFMSTFCHPGWHQLDPRATVHTGWTAQRGRGSTTVELLFNVRVSVICQLQCLYQLCPSAWWMFLPPPVKDSSIIYVSGKKAQICRGALTKTCAGGLSKAWRRSLLPLQSACSSFIGISLGFLSHFHSNTVSIKHSHISFLSFNALLTLHPSFIPTVALRQPASCTLDFVKPIYESSCLFIKHPEPNPFLNRYLGRIFLISDLSSSHASLCCGVPQGSILFVLF